MTGLVAMLESHGDLENVFAEHGIGAPDAVQSLNILHLQIHEPQYNDHADHLIETQLSYICALNRTLTYPNTQGEGEREGGREVGREGKGEGG